MKLLQNSWSDMLVLDHLHQRLHNNLPDETTLHNGQKFDLLSLGLLGVPTLADHFNELQNKLQELKFDVGDYICMKFLLLLNPGENLFYLLFFIFFLRGLSLQISVLINFLKNFNLNKISENLYDPFELILFFVLTNYSNCKRKVLKVHFSLMLTFKT